MTRTVKCVSTAETETNENQLHSQGPQGADAVPNESIQVACPCVNTCFYRI